MTLTSGYMEDPAGEDVFKDIVQTDFFDNHCMHACNHKM